MPMLLLDPGQKRRPRKVIHPKKVYVFLTRKIEPPPRIHGSKIFTLKASKKQPPHSLRMEVGGEGEEGESRCWPYH